MARELIGREEELEAALTAFATLPAIVALEGEAGIGKTSVWRAVLQQLEANGTAVLSARPAEAETHLSYAGLADLLDPVLDDSLAELPAPQRQALEAALLRTEAEGRALDQAAIAFAVWHAAECGKRSASVRCGRRPSMAGRTVAFRARIRRSAAAC